MAASLSRSATEKALAGKLEMSCDERDHRWYTLEVNGQVVARTFVSTGSGYKTLSVGLVAQMAKQLRVNSGFLSGIVNCTKSKDDYVAHLRQIGAM